MTRHNDKNWQAASAYLDNELSEEERASFEARLLNNSALVEALEEVQYVSMMLGRYRKENKQKVSVMPKARARNFLIGTALAAGLALAIINSAIAPEVSVQNPALLHEELSSHKVTFQAMSEFEHVAYNAGLFPDLSAANFIFVGEKETKYGIAGHYTGRRLCRLTLIIGQNIPALDNPDMQSASWKNGRYEYMLVNKGMDTQRFQLIVDYLRNLDANEPTISRLALRKKVRNTRTCI